LAWVAEIGTVPNGEQQVRSLMLVPHLTPTVQNLINFQTTFELGRRTGVHNVAHGLGVLCPDAQYIYSANFVNQPTTF